MSKSEIYKKLLQSGIGEDVLFVYYEDFLKSSLSFDIWLNLLKTRG